MPSWFTSSSKVVASDTNDYTLKKKPLPSPSAIEALNHASENCNIYNEKFVDGQNCKQICMMHGRTDTNIAWKKCKEQMDIAGGKRKSKKYRNKKNKTKRKRSYSSKKT